MSLGVEDGQFEQYADELGRVLQAFNGSPELRDLWLNPANSRDRRMSAIATLTGPLSLSPLIVNTLRLLVDRNRLSEIPDIARVYREMVDERVGRVQATLTSAVPAGAELTASIAGALAAMTNKQIVLETRVDPALLGGLVAQVGGTILDGSLKTQLEQIRQTLRTTRL
jgi:F-type H+-transporting ATPase subunit delta